MRSALIKISHEAKKIFRSGPFVVEEDIYDLEETDDVEDGVSFEEDVDEIDIRKFLKKKEPLIDISEAVKITGYSENSIRKKIKEHRIKPVKKGKKFFYSKTQIQKLKKK